MDAVVDNVEGNIQHAAVPVPKHESPFEDHTLEDVLWEHVATLEQQGAIPQGFYLDPEEWDDAGYPTLETLPLGLKGRKVLNIDLPDKIWRPRAELWSRSLYVLRQYHGLNNPCG